MSLARSRASVRRRAGVDGGARHRIRVIVSAHGSVDDDARRARASILVRALLSGDVLDGVRVVAIEQSAHSALTNVCTLAEACHWRRRALPAVEGSTGRSCALVSEKTGQRMRCRKSNDFIATLFAKIEAETDGRIALSRFDLFHAHAFTYEPARRLGMLFHAKEYPARDKVRFNVDLGHCQVDSNVRFDEDEMSERNILWLSVDSHRSVLAFLDTSNESLKELLTVPELHTTFEGDFGKVQGDVYYFHALRNRKPSERVFIIPR